MNVTASVRVFIGLTKKDYLKKNLGVLEIYRSVTNGEDTYDKEKFNAAEIFIHPDLQTSEAFISTPDVALVKLNRKVKFTSYARPICLNRGKKETPDCPDQSRVSDLFGKKKLGGCVSVGGWGDRFDGDMESHYSSCKTDASPSSPDKLKLCLPEFWNNGNELYNCTAQELNPEDLTKPCRYLIKELAFQKELDEK